MTASHVYSHCALQCAAVPSAALLLLDSVLHCSLRHSLGQQEQVQLAVQGTCAHACVYPCVQLQILMQHDAARYAPSAVMLHLCMSVPIVNEYTIITIHAAAICFSLCSAALLPTHKMHQHSHLTRGDRSQLLTTVQGAYNMVLLAVSSHHSVMTYLQGVCLCTVTQCTCFSAVCLYMSR